MGQAPDLAVVGSYPDTTFARFLRTGTALGEREVGLMSEVARSRFRHLNGPSSARR